MIKRIVASIFTSENKRAARVAGCEDQQRYGAKYSVGKIVSYKKIGKWWVRK